MCMQCLRRSSVSNRSPTALPFFPALSCLLSSWSSLLTVALCFLQRRCFSRKRAKIFKKVCLFFGVGGGLADRDRLVDGVGFQWAQLLMKREDVSPRGRLSSPPEEEWHRKRQPAWKDWQARLANVGMSPVTQWWDGSGAPYCSVFWGQA